MFRYCIIKISQHVVLSCFHNSSWSLIKTLSIFVASIAAASIAVAAEIRVPPVSLDDENLDRESVGALAWRGGIAISMDDPRFGGLSALQISRDGQKLTAVSDRGAWFTADIAYRGGRLVGLRNPRLTRMLAPNGVPISGREADAESLARSRDGGLIVAFERTHRLWRYGGDDPTRARASRLPTPQAWRDMPDNGGIEALTRLCDGALLAVSEKAETRPGLAAAWIRQSSRWQPLSYRRRGDFRPTAAALLPDCGVVFVERSFSFLAGLDIRIVTIPAMAIRPGAVLAPREVARLSSPLTIDNFEGIAARRNAYGDTVLYLISDDNFSPLQRTLLQMFVFDDETRERGAYPGVAQ